MDGSIAPYSVNGAVFEYAVNCSFRITLVRIECLAGNQRHFRACEQKRV